MTATQDRAAIAAQFAAGTSPTALGPALASMSEWVTYNTAAMRESAPAVPVVRASREDRPGTIGARAASVTRRGRRLPSVRSLMAAAGFWAARKAGAR